MIRCVDLFCGAGGTSTGLLEAAQECGQRMDLTAINHWDRAIETHSANHPKARHLCASIDNVNPTTLYAPGELDILWASPECTHHSNARGGKPINDQSRATAWCVVRWADALKPKIILVENVREFLHWGPCGVTGRPIKSKRGEIFRSWIKNLEAIGYRVEWRILCAADYGDPTTRRRLFIQAVLGRRKIVWPEPTHAPLGDADMLGTRKPWVAAREIIDWSKPGRSIFTRKKPLAPKTMDRIYIGLQKFGLAPFIVPQNRGGSPVDSIHSPARTITTTARGVGLAQPYLVELHGTAQAHSANEPIGAIAAGGTHYALAQPFLISTAHEGGARVRQITQPLPTVTGNRGEWALCDPFVLSIDHQANKNGVTGSDEPVSTVTTKQRHAVAQPYLIKYRGTGEGVYPVSQPCGTVTTKERYGLAQPIVDINGERFVVDILFRMLNERELARVQGFPDDYRFAGTKTEIVKQIGNAVPKGLAKALAGAAMRNL